jgi:archaellum biogenesis protein FlaJ (TadC family)
MKPGLEDLKLAIDHDHPNLEQHLAGKKLDKHLQKPELEQQLYTIKSWNSYYTGQIMSSPFGQYTYSFLMLLALFYGRDNIYFIGDLIFLDFLVGHLIIVILFRSIIFR